MRWSKKNSKRPTQKNWDFQLPQFNQYCFMKTYGLVLGLVVLIDAKGSDVVQPIWSEIVLIWNKSVIHRGSDSMVSASISVWRLDWQREKNAIFFPKLFCLTVRKNCSSDRENFFKFFEITWTIYSKSEKSQNFW